jgi:putative ABC transport system permease protein
MIATALAIVLGVGFVAGTLIFADTAKAAMFDQYARVAKDIDVSVQPTRTAGKANSDPFLPLSTVDQMRALPGIGTVTGRMQEPLPLLGPGSVG